MHHTRNTLAAPATLQGLGLFTNKPASITLAPAPPNSGIRFTSHPSETPTLAHPDTLSSAVAHKAFSSLPPRCTSIDLALTDTSTRPLFTIEHLLSAIVGCNIHDCLIAVDGPEIPILDGSAIQFVNAIHSAKVRASSAPLNPITIAHPITVQDANGASVTIEPTASNTPTYSYTLDYGPDSPLTKSTATWDGHPQSYKATIAPARTFCLLNEAQLMQSLGLFKDISPRDLLVIAPQSPSHPAGPIDNTYRFPDEPARHKLLDLIGDLALVGTPLLAKITAIKSGHALHHKAAKAILDSLT